MRDPTMAAATLVGAQADAMKTAAGNEAGAMTGFNFARLDADVQLVELLLQRLVDGLCGDFSH